MERMQRRASRPSLIFTSVEAATLDGSQLVALGMAALSELDKVAATARAPADIFAAFQCLFSAGADGFLSGPTRELLPSVEAARLNEAIDALLYAVRPYLLHRAGLKLLEALLQLHHVHRCGNSAPARMTPIGITT